MNDGRRLPERFRFIVPTVGDRLPDGWADIIPAPKSKVLVIHEDDWRQNDLLSRSLEGPISDTLHEIRTIRLEAGQTVGFRRAHLRQGFDDPLRDSSLDVGDLVTAMGDPIMFFDYVRVAQIEGVVAGGFAFESANGVTTYGTLDGTRVTSVGFEGSVRELTEQPSDSLTALLRSHDLVMVNWILASALE